MRITRRSMIAGAALAPFLARSRIARAQNWPSGIIKIIVPFPPGGTVDPIARLAQNGLQQRLGATIVIENKSGGSGSAGTAAAAKSAPDGNTWLFVFDTHAVNPFLQNLPFDTVKGSRSGGADRHRAQCAGDASRRVPTKRWPMSSTPPRQNPTR